MSASKEVRRFRLVFVVCVGTTPLTAFVCGIGLVGPSDLETWFERALVEPGLLFIGIFPVMPSLPVVLAIACLLWFAWRLRSYLLTLCGCVGAVAWWCHIVNVANDFTKT